MMHHRCPIARPDWPCPFGRGSAQARGTRAAFLGRYADTPVPLVATHVAKPATGRVVRDGDTCRPDGRAVLSTKRQPAGAGRKMKPSTIDSMK